MPFVCVRTTTQRHSTLLYTHAFKVVRLMKALDARGPLPGACLTEEDARMAKGGDQTTSACLPWYSLSGLRQENVSIRLGER